MGSLVGAVCVATTEVQVQSARRLALGSSRRLQDSTSTETTVEVTMDLAVMDQLQDDAGIRGANSEDNSKSLAAMKNAFDSLEKSMGDELSAANGGFAPQIQAEVGQPDVTAVTLSPTQQPTAEPTQVPTVAPTPQPTPSPTTPPPTTASPTAAPTNASNASIATDIDLDPDGGDKFSAGSLAKPWATLLAVVAVFVKCVLP